MGLLVASLGPQKDLGTCQDKLLFSTDTSEVSIPMMGFAVFRFNNILILLRDGNVSLGSAEFGESVLRNPRRVRGAVNGKHGSMTIFRWPRSSSGQTKPWRCAWCFFAKKQLFDDSVECSQILPRWLWAGCFAAAFSGAQEHRAETPKRKKQQCFRGAWRPHFAGGWQSVCTAWPLHRPHEYHLLPVEEGQNGAIQRERDHVVFAQRTPPNIRGVMIENSRFHEDLVICSRFLVAKDARQGVPRKPKCDWDSGMCRLVLAGIIIGATGGRNFGFLCRASIMWSMFSEQFEIAAMPPEQIASEVLMGKSPFVARQKTTHELERLLDILSKPAGVLWASIVECCALLDNDGEVGDGEADGVSKFRSEKHAKRMQEEFAPIACFGDSNLGRRGSGARLVHCDLQGIKRKVSRWHHSGRRGWRELAEKSASAKRSCFSAIITPSMSRRRVADKSVRCLRHVEPKKKMFAERKFADVETTRSRRPSTSSSSWLSRWSSGGRLARGTSEGAFCRQHIHFEKLAQIYRRWAKQIEQLQQPQRTREQRHPQQRHVFLMATAPAAANAHDVFHPGASARIPFEHPAVLESSSIDTPSAGLWTCTSRQHMRQQTKFCRTILPHMTQNVFSLACMCERTAWCLIAPPTQQGLNLCYGDQLTQRARSRRAHHPSSWPFWHDVFWPCPLKFPQALVMTTCPILARAGLVGIARTTGMAGDGQRNHFELRDADHFRVVHCSSHTWRSRSRSFCVAHTVPSHEVYVRKFWATLAGGFQRRDWNHPCSLQMVSPNVSRRPKEELNHLVFTLSGFTLKCAACKYTKDAFVFGFVYSPYTLATAGTRNAPDLKPGLPQQQSCVRFIRSVVHDPHWRDRNSWESTMLTRAKQVHASARVSAVMVLMFRITKRVRI